MKHLSTAHDIENIVLEYLQRSNSIGVFPTPVKKILEYSNLHFEKDIDLSRIDDVFFENYSYETKIQFLNSFGLVRGFLDRKDGKIYLDKSQNKNRQNFVLLHEIGHGVLPWQNLVYEFLDNDSSLDENTILEFEHEANYFASSILFQAHIFQEEAQKLMFGLKSALSLSKKFGASTHATLRKYVETSALRCGLLVLENITKKGIRPSCTKKDLFLSNPFTSTFGDLNIPDEFGYTWAFTKDYYFGKKYHEIGEINLETHNGNVDFRYHFFNNTFNAFVLLFPYNENDT
jgi:Zn-dependent peptidase ImmA (M78 family)